MRFVALFLLFPGCQEAASPPGPLKPESSDVSYFEIGYQDGAAYDLMGVLNSVGTSVTFAVETGATYEIKVLVDPWRSDQVTVHNRTVKADSSELVVGVYCSLAYSVSDSAISIDRKQEQIVLEVGNETYAENVEEWAGGYRPGAVTSQAIDITEDESPFLVMFHPNNMGADSFEMAVKHARSETSYGEIAGIIRKVKQMNPEANTTADSTADSRESP